MALIHRATITPTKPELLTTLLAGAPWAAGRELVRLEVVDAYRFDDPSGDVGMESFVLLVGDGPELHVPLTYRGAPLTGGEPWLVGTMEHSVLGDRWVYDAVGDPTYLTTLLTTVVTGGHQADYLADVDGSLEPRVLTMTVAGSGAAAVGVALEGPVTPEHVVSDATTTTVTVGGRRVVVRRVLGEAAAPDVPPSAGTLVGRWADRGTDRDEVLALVDPA